MVNNLILIINTGSTSTKIGLYEDTRPIFVESIKHSDVELYRFDSTNSQKNFREKIVLDFLKKKGIATNDLSAVAARGGLLRPVESGTYIVNKKMLNDLIQAHWGYHASHLSAQIGYSIAQSVGIPCYIVDPISVDELEPIARYSGHKLFKRAMYTHALNLKAVAKKYSKENNFDYNKIILIVIHLGTGVSISIHKNGRMIDAIDPKEEGSFSIDRSGGLPILQIAKYITENKIEYQTFEKMVFSNGGLYSYLNTKDFMKVENMYKKGDRETINVVNAMAYQIAKEVGALSTVAKGDVNAIIITGGMANAKFFVDLITERINFIAPIKLYPGEDEIRALAEGVSRVLNNKESPKIY